MIVVLLLACAPDLLADPAFRPPTEESAGSYTLVPSEELRVGRPLVVDLKVEAREGLRLQGAVGGGRGRPENDVWTVVPAVPDPSPYWEDLRRYVANDRRAVRPGTTASAPLYLDHELALREPGRYAIQLETDRIGHQVVVPAIEITVAPRDPAADARILKDALATLQTASTKEREGPFRDLLALGTPETLELALSKLEDPQAPAWWTVLVHAHPDREAAARALEHTLVAPDGIVTTAVVEALTAVRYNLATPSALGVPPAPSAVPQLKAYNKERDARRKQLESFRMAIAATLAEALPKKTAGRGEALHALTTIALAVHEPPWKPAWLAAVRADLDQLPDAMAQNLLNAKWTEIRDPATVPALERMAVHATPLGDLALRRLSRLDAAVAGNIARERLRTGALPVSDDGEAILLGLEDLEDPVRKAAVAAALARPLDARNARLIAAYGHPEDADTVKATVPTDRLDTAAFGAYGAFFHNIGQPDAWPLDRVRHPRVLEVVARSARDPRALLPVAVKDLDADHTDVQFAAAEVIAEFGPKETRAALFERMRGADEPLQLALTHALFTARAWTIKKVDAASLLDLLTERRSKNLVETATLVTDELISLEARLEDGVPVLRINHRDYVGPDAILGKLAQLYPGAPVKLKYRGGQLEATEGTVEPLIRQAGLTIYSLRGTTEAE